MMRKRYMRNMRKVYQAYYWSMVKSMLLDLDEITKDEMRQLLQDSLPLRDHEGIGWFYRAARAGSIRALADCIHHPRRTFHRYMNRA